MFGPWITGLIVYQYPSPATFFLLMALDIAGSDSTCKTVLTAIRGNINTCTLGFLYFTNALVSRLFKQYNAGTS